MSTGGGPNNDGSHPCDGWGIQEYEIERLRLTAERDNWMETAAQNQRNTDFYHGLIIEIGEMFGVAAKTSDDGSVQEDVLALKVPELVKSQSAEVTRMEGLLDSLDDDCERIIKISTPVHGETTRAIVTEMRERIAAVRSGAVSGAQDESLCPECGHPRDLPSHCSDPFHTSATVSGKEEHCNHEAPAGECLKCGKSGDDLLPVDGREGK